MMLTNFDIKQQQSCTQFTLQFSASDSFSRFLALYKFVCNTVITHKAIYKGTTYNASMCVVLSEEDDGYSLGKILLILIQNGKDMYLVIEVCHAIRSVDLGMLCLSDTERIECCSTDSLLDYHPLSLYRKGSVTYVILRHAVVST